jgi:cell wall-associated NlpC family hydrolase
MCDRVRKAGEAGDWYKVELPDQRAGYLPKTAAENYSAWKQARRATPENIERAARMFVGRPYLWGGNSPKGFDCSGFTKMVFFLNGIDLQRDSSRQADQGVAVALDDDLSQLMKGDLLFFGRPARRGRPERVVHVGIYLGDKLFIHSSERVRISSLDPRSPLRDENRIRTLLRARRLVPDQRLSHLWPSGQLRRSALSCSPGPNRYGSLPDEP